MPLTGIPGKVIDAITKKLGLQTAVERTQFDLMNTIQPIINMSPDENIDVVASVNSAGNIFVVPTDKDFFLTSIQLSAVLSANSGSAIDTITVTLVSGEVVLISQLSLSTDTATDDSGTIFSAYPRPIQLKRGSNVVYAAASTGRRAIITGFLADN